MKNYLKLLKNKKVHFVGIGGISMSAIAFFMHSNGYVVSGSDIKQSDITDNLTANGIKVYLSHNLKNVENCDAVVYTSAIDSLNEELIYAKHHGLMMIKRSQLLGDIVNSYNYSISVSGSHGKTTTTSMIADIFIRAKYDPTVFLGGISKDYANFRSGSKMAIVEACEYKKNLLDIDAKLKVVLNIDNDHLDSYDGMVDQVNTFRKFMEYGVSLVNKDDYRLEGVMSPSSYSFGIKNTAEFMAKRLIKRNNFYSFDVYAFSRKIGRIRLGLQGKHNVYNALSAFAVAYLSKIPFSIIKYSLESFDGVKRRSENIGNLFNLECVADYAHHPSEIKAMIDCERNIDKTIVVFQPHTYSRTRYLMEEFINVLSKANKLIIYKTYPAREEFDKKGSGKRLWEKLIESGKNDCVYVESEEELAREIDREKLDKERVLFLGAGDIYEIAKKIINNY